MGSTIPDPISDNNDTNNNDDNPTPSFSLPSPPKPTFMSRLLRRPPTPPTAQTLCTTLRLRVSLTLGSERAHWTTRVRNAFLYLMWYDFAITVFPHTTGGRFGQTMLSRLPTLVEALYVDIEDEEERGVAVRQACSRIPEWSKRGRVLHGTLVTWFGDAALFVVQEVLGERL